MNKVNQNIPESRSGLIGCLARLVRCPVCDGTGRLVRRFGSEPCRHCKHGEGDLWFRDESEDRDLRLKRPAYTHSEIGTTIWTSEDSISSNDELPPTAVWWVLCKWQSRIDEIRGQLEFVRKSTADATCPAARELMVLEQAKKEIEAACAIEKGDSRRGFRILLENNEVRDASPHATTNTEG